MITIEPIGTGAARRLADLASRPDVVAFGDHVPETSAASWARWIGSPDPHTGITLGAFRAGRLEAAARLSLNGMRRRLHGASLRLVASTHAQADPAIDALLAALLDASDRWLQVVRCELRCPLGHPRAGGLFASHGFAVEARLAASLREGDRFTDEALLGRVREGVEAPEPLATSLRMPEKGPPEGRVIVRSVQPSDAAGLARTMSEPGVVWGTLQLPWQRAERWAERLASPGPSRPIFLVAEVAGEVAGAGALTLEDRARRAHSSTLGMHVATRFQGRGVGGRLMRALLDQADQRGIVRVELSVFPHNERARRLYERAGFVREGVSRMASFQDGTYADDVLMARVRW